MRAGRILAGLVLAVVLAACGGGEQAADAPEEDATTAAAEEPAAAESEAAEAEPAAGAATVAAAESEFGEILTDGEGRTLYRFVPDTAGASTCTDSCLETWPVLESEGDPEAGTGADAALLATIDREDGATQVTYGDWPLYYFSGDAQPGDTNGQGVGENWYVVAPDGSMIEEAAG